MKNQFLRPFDGFSDIPTRAGYTLYIYQTPYLILQLHNVILPIYYKTLSKTFVKSTAMLLAIVDISTRESVEESISWLKTLDQDNLNNLSIVPTLSSESILDELNLALLTNAFANVSSIAELACRESLENAVLKVAQLKLIPSIRNSYFLSLLTDKPSLREADSETFTLIQNNRYLTPQIIDEIKKIQKEEEILIFLHILSCALLDNVDFEAGLIDKIISTTTENQGIKLMQRFCEELYRVAVINNKVELLKTLLFHQANLIKLPINGENALFAAKSASVVNVLVESGISINETNSRGQSPLHIAITRQNTAMAAILIKANADVGCVDEAGATPLISAALYADIPLLKLLAGPAICCGAHFKTITIDGKQKTAMVILEQRIRSTRLGHFCPDLQAILDILNTNPLSKSIPQTALLLSAIRWEKRADAIKMWSRANLSL